ncbi:hypothetical protein [Pseudothauera lacus]|uniref:hypothetical protein n=1 Tax=Pseudothauera lacus TaxID=2136175 RepID=UPI0011B20D87|nr:hypothetical protein [Pseudothauera lacus]
MKKLANILLIAGLGVSSSVFAQAMVVPANGVVTGGATGDCELLSESVRINLSSNVVGAFACDEATNTITVGSCHNAGSRNDSLLCAQIGVDASGNGIFNHNDCDAAAVAAGTVIQGAADFRGFFAQTSGGSVAPSFLGGSCSAAILTAHENFQP